MSEDIRKMIDKVKNFKQFVNENVSSLKEISLDAAIRLTQEDDVKNVYYSLLGNDNEKWVDKSINYVKLLEKIIRRKTP
jgi:hypothetical protein